MDKSLSDKEKKEAAPSREQEMPATGRSVGAIGAYAGGYGQNTGLSEQSWQTGRRAWNASPQGRLAIRLFSRGIMGATFFTAGGLLTRKWMHGSSEWVEAEERFGSKYDKTLSLWKQKNPLQFIAKLIDNVVGTPIEYVVTAVAGEEMGKRSVRFRPTKFKDAEHAIYVAKQQEFRLASRAGKAGSVDYPNYYRGRSLGNEAVSITFDFFCASIGDALGRDIADWFDPAVKKPWVKDGHVDLKDAAKRAVKSTWRYVTYNGGEDWAVAIPYAYFMKAQRAVINHYSPGFAYDFDRHLNGGSFKVDDKGNIIGNYSVEGALDLQGRFTFYNMGTLMYREAYHYLAKKMHGEPAVLYGDPDKTPYEKKSLAGNLGTFVKWTMRSMVKAGIYMTPAVPFFWITRSPQTKHRGVFINPKGRIVNGVPTGAELLCYENELVTNKLVAQNKAGADLKYETVHANEMPDQVFTPQGTRVPRINTGTGMTVDTPVYWARYDPHPASGADKQFGRVGSESLPGRRYNPVAQDHPASFDPHARTFGSADRVLNKAGKLNYEASYLLDPAAKKADAVLAKNPKIDKVVKTALSLRPGESLTRFTHPFVYASASYTPYMYMKAELSRQWDTGRMDSAAERMIDGAAKLNWGEFKAGVGEVSRAVLHRPFKDSEREAEAMKRAPLGPPTDGVNRKTKKPSHRHMQRDGQALSWRERVVQGKPEEVPEVGANRPKSYKEQEEMRKALETLAPPTNSVH